MLSLRAGILRTRALFDPRSTRALTALGINAFALATLLLAGCSGGSGGAGIPGLTATVPALDANSSYVGPRMNFLRYSHTTTILPNGDALVVGGTDERHLTATDLVEIFDPDARVELGTPIPETIAGDFIDQDIDGNLITLTTGGRFWHTATNVVSGRVVVVGGTSNINFGIANPTTEIYDPLTRSFTEPTLTIDPANDIALPRVRHSAEVLPNGQLLIIGGQESTQVTLPPGILTRVYPTTRTMEVFDLATLTFSPALDGGGLSSTLSNSRGRAGHTSVALAGVDEILGTSDDIVMILGGLETLSAASGAAPLSMFPWQNATTKLPSVDFYSAQSGATNLAQGMVLTPRLNDPIAINLGADRRQSPFGDTGMANIALVFGGDSDNQNCPQGASAQGETTDRSELVVVTYSGIGAGGGPIFSRFTGQDMVNGAAASNTYDSGHEFLIHARAPMDNCSNFNRSRTDGVLMDMRRVYGSPRTVSVVVTAGGYDQTAVPGGCATTGTEFCGANEIAGFEFFDPFWDPSLIGNVFPLDQDTNGDGMDDIFPWEFDLNATNANPVGIGGTWLAYDALIPDDGVVGYADGPNVGDTATVALKQLRCMHTIDRIAGQDGVLGNLDDRVLVIGGSDQYYPFFGNSANSISCEIFVPPGAGP